MPKTISQDTRTKLLDVAEILGGVKVDEFDMRRWRDSCGTVGCVIHHYVLARPESGLKLVSPNPDYNPRIYEPSFDGRAHVDALSRYFGISEDEAMNFFMPDSYDDDQKSTKCTVTPQMVIDRILDFLGEPVSDEERGAMMEGDRFE